MQFKKTLLLFATLAVSGAAASMYADEFDARDVGSFDPIEGLVGRGFYDNAEELLERDYGYDSELLERDYYDDAALLERDYYGGDDALLERGYYDAGDAYERDVAEDSGVYARAVGEALVQEIFERAAAAVSKKDALKATRAGTLAGKNAVAGVMSGKRANTKFSAIRVSTPGAKGKDAMGTLTKADVAKIKEDLAQVPTADLAVIDEKKVVSRLQNFHKSRILYRIAVLNFREAQEKKDKKMQDEFRVEAQKWREVAGRYQNLVLGAGDFVDNPKYGGGAGVPADLKHVGKGGSKAAATTAAADKDKAAGEKKKKDE